MADGPFFDARMAERLRRQALSYEQVVDAVLALDARAADLETFARWLLTLDDPEDVLGREERRTVTLTKIIDRARDALGEPT